MNVHVLLTLILIFGIVPNLGFFTLEAFFLLSIFGIIAWIILGNPRFVEEESGSHPWAVVIIFLISATYYGGLYQNPFSILVGKISFYLFCAFLSLRVVAKKEISSHIFVIFYVFLALLTIYGSPHPIIDTFVILKEAPQKLLHGINPYDSMYSQVYKDIVPNYFSYLPMSIFFFMPFILLFNDPRFGLAATALGTYFLLNKLQKKKRSQKYLLSSFFLFAPRSFYMLEHAYLDTLIFFLFVAGAYFYNKRRGRVFSFLISLFFLMKQNVVILLPLFVRKLVSDKTNIAIFLIPFLSLLAFFAWNPSSFIYNVFTSLRPDNLIMKTSPFQMTITIPNIIFQIFHFPHATMQGIFIAFAALALLFAVFIYLKKEIVLTRKIILVLFFGYFLSYHAFFNSYYLVILFLFFDLIIPKTDMDKSIAN